MKTRKPVVFQWTVLLSIVSLFIFSGSLYAVDDTQTLVPPASWVCGMTDGIPKPENGTLVFTASIQLDQIYNVGITQYGQRSLLKVKSGTITGSKINGSVIAGGLDFQLVPTNGVIEVEQVLTLKTSDSKYIYMRSCGLGAGAGDVRIVPDFEAASSGSYKWLNSGKYVGRRTVDTVNKTMKLSVYDVSAVTIKPNASTAIKVAQPKDYPAQPWNCRSASSSEVKGNTLYTETVKIGSSQSVGTSKRGYRNIIPITGGTATGSIAGTVLSGGADYQILSSPMTIDARYAIQTGDGELILVRNCGPASAPVPTFEARAASQYGGINNKLWLSSSPSTGIGTVKITVYESK